MDPNVCLQDCVSLSNKILKQSDDDNVVIDVDDAVEFAYKFDALNEWISKGGFLPRVWHPSNLG